MSSQPAMYFPLKGKFATSFMDGDRRRMFQAEVEVMDVAEMIANAADL